MGRGAGDRAGLRVKGRKSFITTCRGPQQLHHNATPPQPADAPGRGSPAAPTALTPPPAPRLEDPGQPFAGRRQGLLPGPDHHQGLRHRTVSSSAKITGRPGSPTEPATPGPTPRSARAQGPSHALTGPPPEDPGQPCKRAGE